MAEAKSVIEIDILDDKFKEFAAVFERFQATLDKMPKNWASAGKATEEAGNKANKVHTEEAKAAAEAKKNAAEAKKTAAESKKTDAESIKHKKAEHKLGIVRLAAMEASTVASTNMALSFAMAAVSIAKWVSLAALGGWFGLAVIARSAGGYRKNAIGADTTTGALRAVQSRLSKYVDSDGGDILEKIASLQSDPSKTGILQRMGGSSDKTPLENLTAVMKTLAAQGQLAKDKYGHINMALLQAYGFDALFNESQKRRIINNKGELSGDLAETNRFAAAMTNPDSENKALQDFWLKLVDVKNELEVAFIAPLSQLAEPLGNLTTAVKNAVVDFLGSDTLKDAISDFTSWLDSGRVKRDVKDFTDTLTDLALVITKVARWFVPAHSDAPVEDFAGHNFNERPITSDKDLSISGRIVSFLGGGDAVDKLNREEELWRLRNPEITGYAFEGSVPTAEIAPFFSKLEAMHQLPKGVLAAVRYAESSNNDKSISPKGAQGAFQFMPKTLKEYNVTHPFDPYEEGNAAAKKLQGLMKRYNNNLDYALAAYNGGEVAIDAAAKKGSLKYAPDESRIFSNRVQVIVTNAANTDLGVSTNAAVRY